MALAKVHENIQLADRLDRSLTLAGVNRPLKQWVARAGYVINNPQIAIYGSSNTTGQSSLSTGNAHALTIRGAGGVSVGWSNGQFIISGAAGGTGGGGSVNFSAGTTSNNLGSVVFSNLNGISFGLNGSTITGSHNALTSQSNQALSGSNGSFTFQTATFGNLNGLSFYTSNGSLVGSYTVPSQSVQPVALSGSNGSFLFSTATFGALNGITFYTSNGSMVASHNALTSQSNQQLSLYATGNTTNNSSTVLNASSLLFNAQGGVTMGFSNGSIQVSGATGGGTGGGGANFSTWWHPAQFLTTIGAPINASASVQHLPLYQSVTGTRLDLAASINVATTTNNSSGAYLYSLTVVLLTRNGETLNSVSSTTTANTITWSSNNTSAVTGVRFLSVPLNINASPGNYWIAAQLSTRATGHAGPGSTSLANTFSMMGIGSAMLGAYSIAEMGGGTASSLGWFIMGMNSSTGNLTAMSLSNVSKAGTLGNRAAIGVRIVA